MSGTRKILFTFLLACLCLTVKAQQPKDSLAIYKKIQEKASRHKVTQWIYDAIFVDMQNNEEEDSVVVSTNQHTENPFKKYDGKVIRNIRVVVYDPFGYSVNDTTMEAPRGLARMGNVYHIKSRPGIIRNMLLFKKDDKLDPLRISESERILRQAPYVNDARIYISSVRIKKKKTDSVDIVVYTQDKWTFVPESNFSLDAPDILLTQKNVFGFGHELQMGFIHSPSANYITNYGRYGIFNIRKTFISSYVNYYNSRDLTYFGLVLDRPFYSPLAKWAGGVSLTKNYGTFAYLDANNIESKEPLNSLVQDYWVARGWRTGSRKTIRGQSSNIIAGVRYENILFQQRPSGEIDVNRQNIDQATYLGSIGFTRREYYKERYIYRFGANEDVPIGFAFTFTGGYRQRELASSLYYNGVSFSIGNHFERFGYVSGNIGIGSFYNRLLANRGVVSIGGNWFSELIRKNRWYVRQFASIQSVNGLNREAYEFITINGRQMYGFNSPLLQGKNKVILNLETVFYTPYSFLGFRFAPIVMMGFAKIGNSPAGMFNSRIYQSYSIGLLLRNENLIANSFQFSIGFYPFIPGTGSDVFQANPVGSFSLRVRDFTIGKPEVVGFQ